MAQPSLRGSEPPIRLPVVPVDDDALSAAMRQRTERDSVPPRPQSGDGLLGHAALHLGDLVDIERTGRVDRLLDVHAVVDHVGDEMGVAHRLEIGAHDAERHRAAPVAHGERRDDRMHRPLARRDGVRVVRLDHKSRSAIVQHHTGFLRADAGTEGRIERTDQRYRHAVAIDDREVDGVARRSAAPSAAARAFPGRSALQAALRSACRASPATGSPM